MSMSRNLLVTNAILWAAAIVAAALLHAPPFLSAVLLPILGTMALLFGARARTCDA